MHAFELYEKHIERLQSDYEKVCDELSLSSIVIDAGIQELYFEDDQSYYFRPNHQFAHWTPLLGEGHLLQMIPGRKPILIVYYPEDFWHERQSIDSEVWKDCFEIRMVNDIEDSWKKIESLDGKTAYQGPRRKLAQVNSLATDVETLDARLNWNRSYKTDYEVACLEVASRVGGLGHEAATKAFLEGGSELDVLYAYLQAVRCREAELPYNPIICLDEKAAFLHYEAKRDNFRNGKVLLIDAGASVQGYGSDITRTSASPNADEEFHALLADADKMQRRLVDAIKPGLSMAELHVMSHSEIADLLIQHDILKDISAEAAVEKGLSAVFYPHGIGHMLGILVHDVAGKQIDPEGNPGKPDPRFPKLRSLRKLEAGHVLTVEPGIYFIDVLLQKERSGSKSKHFNWSKIDKLKSHGGIRIEDNILVTTEGHRNLTRAFLA